MGAVQNQFVSAVGEKGAGPNATGVIPENFATTVAGLRSRARVALSCSPRAGCTSAMIWGAGSIPWAPPLAVKRTWFWRTGAISRVRRAVRLALADPNPAKISLTGV